MVALAVGVLGSAVVTVAETVPATSPLTNVASVLNLSTARASDELPVRLTAAVTYVDPAGGILFVEDETGGIFVGTRQTVPLLRRGELIDISGRSDAGIHLPAISQAIVQPAGHLQKLAAAQPKLQEVVEGRFDCRFIELRGVVRQVGENRGRVLLSIDAGEGPPIEASFLHLSRTNLWDATVRIRGVCGLRGMKGGRILSVILYCWSNEAITIEQPGLADPFGAPVRMLAELQTNHVSQRVRLDGRIIHLAAGGSVTVQDDQLDTYEVEARHSSVLRTNDRVQISGVPAWTDGRLMLRNVELRAVAPMRPMGSNVTSAARLAPLLTRVADLRQLGDAASAGLPVRLRGTVTYYDRAWILFVQDNTGGIYISPRKTKLGVQAGHWVEVDGFTHPGDYAPVIHSPHFTVIDQATQPTAKTLLPEVLFRGQHDSLRVEVSGVVHSVAPENGETARLELGTSAGHVTTYLRFDGTNLPLHLVDADVRVRGVCGSTFNQRRQFTAPRLYVASTNDIIVDRAAPVDPFAIEAQPIATLLRFGSLSMHRAKVAGTVTLIDPRESILCVQDETGGVFVRAPKLAGFKVGDALEALGFPATSGYTPSLADATARVVGQGRVRPGACRQSHFRRGRFVRTARWRGGRDESSVARSLRAREQ
jgi:hypothetical protein